MTETLLQIIPYFFNPERIPVAVLALGLTAIVGVITGPAFGNGVPLFWQLVEKAVGGAGIRLDRTERPRSDLIVRGFVITSFGLAFSAAAGSLAHQINLRYYFYNITELILLTVVLSAGVVWSMLIRLFRAMKEHQTGKGAYYMIARSSRTDLSASDDFGITRSGMGFAARLFDKGVVAPVFWYVAAGLPGAFIYAGTAALAWRFGRDGFTRGFGIPALFFERIMGFIPHIIAGFFMALAGLFTPTGGMTRAFTGILKKKGRAPYQEGGLTVTAMAYALNISLGGPVIDLDGRTLQRAWAGPENATARLEPGHLRRALYMALMAYLLFMAALMGIKVVLNA